MYQPVFPRLGWIISPHHGPRSVGAVHAKPELDGHFGMLGAFQGFLGDSTSSGMTDL